MDYLNILQRSFLALVVTIGLTLGNSQQLAASDSYFVCSGLNDEFSLERDNGWEVYRGETLVKLMEHRELKLKETVGFCSRPSGQTYPWRLSTSLHSVLLEANHELNFLCEAFDSVAPAAEDCKDLELGNFERQGDLVEIYTSDEREVIYPEIQTYYRTADTQCTDDRRELISIYGRSVVGPSFMCALEAPTAAGTGMIGIEGVCSVNGKLSEGILSMDLGNFNDHFELALPDEEEWISLYPCTPVEGLN